MSEIEFDDDKRRDEILDNAMEELKIHFGTVTIITTAKNSIGNTDYHYKSWGNVYEAYGALRSTEVYALSQLHKGITE